MDVFMNDAKVEDLTFETGTLEEAIRNVQDDWCAPGQLIVGLRCDGLEIAGGQMSQMLLKPVCDFKRLEVYTGTPATLVNDAMEQAVAALGETGTARKEVAELLTQGKVVEGVEELGEALRVWQQVHEALTQSIQMLNLDADSIMVEGRPLIEAMSGPKDALVQIKNALEAQDYVLLADVLQYEFDDVEREWGAILLEIRHCAEHHDDVEGTI